MPIRLILAFGASFFGVALCSEGHAATPYDRLIQTVAGQKQGSDAGREAWAALVASGPKALPAILTALDNADTVRANWLRTAFDRIFDKSFESDKGKAIDAEGLLTFVKDERHAGRARRLALEVVDRLRPGTSARFFPGRLDDPEFRYEAVDVAVKEAEALLKAGNKDAALEGYRKAFAAVRDLQQAKRVATGLHKLGSRVSVAEHLGFLTDWYVIGPFDAMGMKGFKTVYSPERRVDLTSELPGKGKQVSWKRFHVTEPDPTTGGAHVALVNLRIPLGDAEDAVAFAYTKVKAARAQDVEFRGAADDNFTVWVNGKRAFGFEEYRNGVRLDRHRFPVKLRAGMNTVLVKICQFPASSEPNWEFLLRIVDKTGRGLRLPSALSALKNDK